MWSARVQAEIMAALKVVVLLAVIGSSSLALPFSNDVLTRMRRQLPPPQCQADFFALSSDACFSLFGEVATVTVADAKQFCNNGCSDKLKTLFDKLIADCGDFASGIDQTQLSLLPQICLKDGLKHSDGLSHTCLEDIASIMSSEPQFAQDCMNTFPRDHVCTSACQQTLDYITKNLGCCYNVLVTVVGNITSSDVWTTCKVPYPKQC